MSEPVHIDLDYVKKQYHENGKSQEEIANELGVSQWAISQRLRSSGIPTKTRTWKLDRYRTKHSINHASLDILSPKTAWVLGWFLSDGYIKKSPHNGFALAVAKKDADILGKIKDFFSYTGKIHESKVFLKKTNKFYFRKSLSMNSAHLKNRFIEFGILPNKSLNEKFSNLIKQSNDEDIIRHYIRGIFEGDGSIIFKKSKIFQIVGTKELLEDIQAYLIKYLGVHKTKITINAKSTKNHFCLRYSGKYQLIKILDWIYTNHGDCYLDRKFNKYLEVKKCAESY